MLTLCFATHNQHKLAEIQALFSQHKLAVRLVSLADLACHDDIPETGHTLEENALLKARYVWQKYGISCFADDTGLEVEALGGMPGVYSARYAGLQKDEQANLKKLLQELLGQANRRARFRTCIAFISSQGREYLFDGSIYGQITHEPMGKQGFGYDPIFMPDGERRTFAQMTQQEKNEISHRAKAFQLFCQWLQKNV